MPPNKNDKIINYYEEALNAASKGQTKKAASLYIKALKLDPCFFQAHSNLGNLYLEIGLNQKALFHFNSANKYCPNNSMILSNLGNAERRLGNLKSAINHFEKSISLNPYEVNGKFNLAGIFFETKQYHHGLSLYQGLIDKDCAHPILVWSVALSQLNSSSSINLRHQIWEQLEKAIDKLLSKSTPTGKYIHFLTPEATTKSYTSLFLELLIELNSKKYHQLIEELIESLERYPNEKANALFLKGSHLLAKKEFDAALSFFDELSKFEASSRLKLKLADIYYWRGEIDKASKMIKGLDISGRGFSDFEIYYLFQKRNLEAAWLKYSLTSNRRNINLPKLEPDETLSDTEELLVFRDQGVGDELMFLSCFKDLLCEFGEEKLTLELSSRLIPAVKRMNANVKLIAYDDTLGDDIYRHFPGKCIRLSSLPQRYRRTKTSFPGSPYLQADPSLKSQARSFLNALGQKPNIGIAWKGGHHKHAELRKSKSAFLSDFQPLFRKLDVNWVNLQYGAVTDEINDVKLNHGVTIHNPEFVKPLDEIETQIALISELDYVIQCDNTSIHIAGAVGTESILLVGSPAEWRWFSNEKDDQSAWYSSVRMIKKGQKQSWEELVESLVPELTALAATKS